MTSAIEWDARQRALRAEIAALDQFRAVLAAQAVYTDPVWADLWADAVAAAGDIFEAACRHEMVMFGRSERHATLAARNSRATVDRRFVFPESELDELEQLTAAWTRELREALHAAREAHRQREAER